MAYWLKETQGLLQLDFASSQGAVFLADGRIGAQLDTSSTFMKTRPARTTGPVAGRASAPTKAQLALHVLPPTQYARRVRRIALEDRFAIKRRVRLGGL